ncbi:MAG: hypothetical protein HY675_00365 [Chloroflexi bacterium]|nr:hypothetical protein [Chloroflexota bacterium]
MTRLPKLIEVTMTDVGKIIDQLSHADALSILRTLADEDEQLGRRIAKIAQNLLSDVDREDVADYLYAELDALEVDDVWEQAGPSRHGYAEPSEVAYQMVEDVLEPFLHELRRYQELGMSVESTQLCAGLLMGLYRFERASTSEFKDWAPDAPISFAAEVVEAWKKGRPSDTAVATLTKFIREELSGWGQHLLQGKDF